jgi:hypothetical protein
MAKKQLNIFYAVFSVMEADDLAREIYTTEVYTNRSAVIRELHRVISDIAERAAETSDTIDYNTADFSAKENVHAAKVIAAMISKISHEQKDAVEHGDLRLVLICATVWNNFETFERVSTVPPQTTPPETPTQSAEEPPHMSALERIRARIAAAKADQQN